MKYLAIDIGAREIKSSLAEMVNGNLELKKVQSFKISAERKEGHLIWNLDDIYQKIIKILSLAGAVSYISIDSFASDFVLLDEDDNPISDAVSYLDERTRRITSTLNQDYIYSRTGAHSRRNSTLYQLLALKEEEKSLYERSVSLLFLPDYLNFLLTGVKMTSQSMASTSALVNSETRSWDDDLLESLDLKKDIFGEIKEDGAIIGPLKEEVAKEIGYDAVLILSGHDTSLAYLSAPLDDDTIMLSVGGFARLGTTSESFNLSDGAKEKNYNNAVIPGGAISLTKYLMGSLLIQRLKAKMNEGTSYDEIMRKARAFIAPASVDVGAIDFEESDTLSAINKELEREGLDPVSDLFEASAIVYNSLALYYKKEIEDYERVKEKTYSKIAIVGGGAKDSYLALLLALRTRKTVIETSSDAALIGNLIFQMEETGTIKAEEKDELIRKAIGRTTYIVS